MRQILLVLVAVSFAAMLTAGTAGVSNTLTHVQTYADQWYVPTDPPVGLYENLTWNPGPGDKRRFRDEPVLASPHMYADRAICWRVDSGANMNIKWKHVARQLEEQFGLKIGETRTVNVCGSICAPECCNADLAVYSAYTREVFRVRQNGLVAEISVLVPVDGMLHVLWNVETAPYPACAGVSAPVNPGVVCATMDPANPRIGTACEPVDPFQKSGDRFRDEPVLLHDVDDKTSTWGKIKSLYADD